MAEARGEGPIPLLLLPPCFLYGRGSYERTYSTENAECFGIMSIADDEVVWYDKNAIQSNIEALEENVFFGKKALSTLAFSFNA